MTDALPPPPYEPGEPETIEGPGGAATGAGTRRGLAMGVGIAALVLLAGGAGIYLTMQGGNDPEGVVERFFKAVDAGQCEKAVDLLVFDEGIEREDSLEECESSRGEVEIISFEVIRVDEEPEFEAPDGAEGSARVYYRIDAEEDGDGEDGPVESALAVALFDGSWKILIPQPVGD